MKRNLLPSKLPIRFEVALILIFICLFLFFRLKNLEALPVYLDEAIYINWANSIKQDLRLAHISMQDGKTPLYFWITSQFLKWLESPLFAARLVSVIAGLGTMLSSWFLARFLFGQKIALLSLLFYPLIPYSQFIERMAFADSLLVFLGTLGISLTFIFVKQKDTLPNNLTTASGGLIIGIVLALAFLTKSSAKIYFLPIFLIIAWQIIVNIKNPRRLFFLFVFAFLAWLSYSEIINAFRIGASRFFLNIATKETLLAFTPQQVFNNPLNPVYLNNLPILVGYLLAYVSLPILLLVILATIKFFKKRNPEGIIVSMGMITITAALFLSARTPASRYFLPVVPFLVLLGACGFFELTRLIKNKLALAALFTIIFLPILNFNLKSISNPLQAPFYSEDKHFLFEGSLSGIGVEETINHLEKVIEENDVILAVDAFWGQPDYIELKINSKPHKHQFYLRKFSFFIDIKSWKIEPKNRAKMEMECKNQLGEIIQNGKEALCQIIIPYELKKEAKTKKVFFASFTTRDNPSLILGEAGVKLIKDIPRLKGPGRNQEHFYLYEVSR